MAAPSDPISWLGLGHAPPAAGPAIWVGSAAQALDLTGRPPPNEADLTDALRHPPGGRRDFLVRRSLLRLLAARRLACSPDRVVVAYDAAGAPRLDGSVPLFLSAASRAGYLAIGVAESPIGVDVETLATPAEPAWNVLAREEREHLKQRPGPDRWPAFLDIWTGKEAYLKALGLGLEREPAEIAILPGPATRFRVLDRGRPVHTVQAQHARLRIGAEQILGACVVLPERPHRGQKIHATFEHQGR